MDLLKYTKISPDNLLHFLLPALLFVTPISSSAKSILLPMVIIIILLSPTHRQHLMTLCANRWCQFLLLLFFIAVIGCLWSQASLAERGLVLEKWSKLLYLPILIVGFREEKTRRWAAHAFLFAMLLTCLISIVLHLSQYNLSGKAAADGVFRNHIMTGIMMSFATYLTAIFFVQQTHSIKKNPKLSRIGYLLMGLLFSYQIFFVNQSRSGYVVYLLLTSLFIIQVFDKRQMMIAFLCTILAFSGCFYLSQVMRDTVRSAIQNIHTYQHDKDTSLGYRLQFHSYAKQLFQRHPLIGGGTGSFTYSFRTDDPVPSWTHSDAHSGRLLEPHSQYWLVAAELGLVGLICFALLYAELFVHAWRLQVYRPIAFALLIIMLMGNLTDSLLFYSGSGYFFILFLALCFAEKMDSSNIKKSKSKVSQAYA